jgi:MoxR-like ATPase
VDQLRPTLTPADVTALQTHARAVRVEPPVADYLLDLVEATPRPPGGVARGQHPGGPGPVPAAQAQAVVAGRDYATPDDVKALAEPVLATG